MTRLCPVTACDRPAHPDFTICVHHEWALTRDLEACAALAPELDVSLARQTANGHRNGGRSAERPLPYDYGVSEALSVLRSTLGGWVRELLEPPDGRPADDIGSRSGWLLARIDRLRTSPAAEQAVDEIGAAVGECWRAIDRKRERIYCGPCGHQGCLEDLYAAPGRAEVPCRGCGVVHGVAARREAMRAHVDGRLMTVSEIARLAAYFGEFTDTSKTEGMLGAFIRHQRMQAHGVDRKGRPTYPFGESLSLMRENLARRAIS